MKKLLVLLSMAALCQAAEAQSATSSIPTSSGMSVVDPNAPVVRPTPVEPFVDSDHTGDGRLGVKVGFLKNGLPFITALTQGGPGMDFGLRVGDVIVRIGKNDPLSLTPEQCRLSLHGEPGSGIELTLERNDDPHPIVVAVKRRELPSDALDSIPVAIPGTLYKPDPRDVPYANY